MKIIFLDIDGVLNTSKTFYDNYVYFKKTGIRKIPLDEERIVYLKEIIQKTEAKIVLSSSWRLYFEKNIKLRPINEYAQKLVDLLSKYDLFIYDITPMERLGVRQNEINMYLESHPDIDSFVILDDDTSDLFWFIDNHLIKMNFYDSQSELSGLCPEHIPLIISVLNKKKILKRK